MSAYLVFTRGKVFDEAEFDTYEKAAPATLAGHPVKPLAFYGKHEDLEGEPTNGTVILEFPDAAAAKAWYDGPAYREVREHRFKSANFHVTLVEGV